MPAGLGRSKPSKENREQHSTELTREFQFTHNHAVTIGIDRYADPRIRDLVTAVNDARRIAATLKEDYGYQVDGLYDRAATGAALRSLLCDQLPQRIEAGDRLLIYIASHGVALDNEHGPAGRLVPHDARLDEVDTYWSMSEFYASLRALPCRHLLVVLDCCFAGSFRWASARDIPIRRQELYRERYLRCIKNKAWQVLTSAAHDQEARDWLSDPFGDRAEGKLHSPFAKAFIDVLQRTGEAEEYVSNHPGGLTVTMLYTYLRDAVPESDDSDRSSQIPGLWRMPEDDNDKGEFVLVRPAELSILLENRAPSLDESNNPYRGLRPYDTKHADLYFGRDSVTKRLSRTACGTALTLITGHSGVGKSSLIRAGLIPELEKLGWSCSPPQRPGAEPDRALSLAMAAACEPRPDGPSDDEVVTQVDSEMMAADRDAPPVLLVIDQLEEVYTKCSDEGARRHFFEHLKQCMDADREIHIVCSVRSEFALRVLDDLEKQAKGIAYERFTVKDMTQDELRAAIVGPAQMRALFFEPPGLVDKLVNQFVGMPGALPLLSYTLNELYVRCAQNTVEDGTPNRVLSEEIYKTFEGISGILERQTKKAMETEADGPAMRRILLRMIDHTHGSFSRRRVYINEEFDYIDEKESGRVRRIRAKLVELRLAVTNDADQEHEPWIEPAHDFLATHWADLVNWARAEEILPAATRRRLREAALNRNKNRGTALWDGDRSLPEVVRLLNPPPDTPDALRLNRIETEFVRKSRNRRRLRQALGWIASGVLSILLAVAVWQYRRADHLRYEQIVVTGRVAIDRGDWIEGDRQLTAAVTEDRSDRLRLEIERLRGLFALNRRDDMEEILFSYLERPDLGPYRAVVTLYYGDFLMSQGVRYTEGEALVAEALKDPDALGIIDPADVHFARGLVATVHDKGIEHFEGALAPEMNPFHHRANANLLIQLVLSGRFDDARQRSRRMREFFPEDPLAYLVEALLDLLEGRPETGLALLRSQRERLGDAQLERLETMFQMMSQLVTFVQSFEGLEYYGADELFALLLWLHDMAALSHDDTLGGFGLDVAMVRKIEAVITGLITALMTFQGRGAQAAIEALEALHAQHPEATLLLVQGFLHLVAIVNVIPKTDDAAATLTDAQRDAIRGPLQRARDLFDQAATGASLIPWMTSRWARMARVVTDSAALMLDPDDASLRAAMRRELDWLARDAEATASERTAILEIFTQASLSPPLLLRVLIPWLEEDPDDLAMLLLRADAELRARHYDDALDVIDQIRSITSPALDGTAKSSRLALTPEQTTQLRDIERKARARLLDAARRR